jgi:single-strand DNA-binding protein
MRRSRSSRSTTAREGRKEIVMIYENDVRLIGNLGRDPEIRVYDDGRKVASLSVATNRRWKDREGEWHEATDWVPVVVFGPLAELAEEQLGKGSYVYLRGRIRTSRWEKDGETNLKTEVVATKILDLGAGKEKADD